MNITVKQLSDMLKKEEINEQREALHCMRKKISEWETRLNCREILQNSPDWEL